MLECPNTIFYLCISTEREMGKLELFMKNIKNVRCLGTDDIYNWCNRQKITYQTKYNYHKELSFFRNLRYYLKYTRQKMKYQTGIRIVYE